MNLKLAQAAIAAVTDPAVEQQKGFCSRFVRQVVEKAYGSEYRSLFGPSAIATGKNFRDAGLGLKAGNAGAPEQGDILFKMTGSGGFGHVGIFVGPQGVAENSSTSLGRVQGAKGYRSLAQFGPCDLVGRIPNEQQPPGTYALFLNGQKIASMPVREGKSLCPVREWAKALGFQVDWDEDSQQVLLEGQAVPAEVTLIDGKAFIHVIALIQLAGRYYTVDNAARIVAVI